MRWWRITCRVHMHHRYFGKQKIEMTREVNIWVCVFCFINCIQFMEYRIRRVWWCAHTAHMHFLSYLDSIRSNREFALLKLCCGTKLECRSTPPPPHSLSLLFSLFLCSSIHPYPLFRYSFAVAFNFSTKYWRNWWPYSTVLCFISCLHKIMDKSNANVNVCTARREGNK